MNDHEELIKGLLEVDLDFVMEDIMNIAEMLDKTYQDKPSNYYLKYTHLSHSDAQTLVLGDLINWLSVLAVSDGDFSIIEIEFIKRYLRLNMSNLGIIDFVQNCVKSGFLESIPLSIPLFMEDDNVRNKMNDEVGDTRRQNFTARLFLAFQALGLQFICCDGEVKDEEMDLFIAYNSVLEARMRLLDIESFSESYRQLIKDEIGL